MAEVIWSEPALLQLDAIASFIALDKPEAARAVVQKIVEVTDHLARFKKMGRKIPEFPRPDYRHVWIRPCWIYYRIRDDEIHILHVRRAEQPLRRQELIDDV